ncbi:carbamoyltransferase family protein [Bariatricus sp. HCP28S3_C2]|uniref:carbamoyltransferase family protein n=1 Tax=unclassified Bariatricus TaxID=2677046 RepID=UPI003F887713
MNDKVYFIMGINPCIWGLNYHNPSVVLILQDKIIYAIEEERINRKKNSMGIFPENAVNECKKIAQTMGIPIKKVIIGFDPNEKVKRLYYELEALLKYDQESFFTDKCNCNIIDKYKKEVNLICDRVQDVEKLKMLLSLKLNMPNVEIRFANHHLSHAISAYIFSKFDEALCVVCDGVGEYAATSIWTMKGKIRKKISEIAIPNSLGYFYAIATAYLGFKPWSDEGKVMALAPYGKYNKYIFDKLEKVISYGEGSYNVSFFIENSLTNGLALDINKGVSIFEELFGIDKCTNNLDDIYKDIAFAVQTYVENIVLSLINYWSGQTKISRVCVAGGIFMNCKLNMYIRENAKIDKLYVQPVAGDAGTSIGAAFSESNVLKADLSTLSLGNQYNRKMIYEELKLIKGVSYRYIPDEELCNNIAKALVDGKIVCWFQKGAEFGARALGNRSLLMDPRKRRNADTMNELIKHREKWRPFACSILFEYADLVLENFDENSKPYFMIEAYKVREEWINKIGAVIHPADYTTRPQLVKEENYPLYYKLIYQFYKMTGIPLIMNTSFNDKGEPIVLSPKDAINFFVKNKADLLVMGNYVVEKEK